MNIQKILNLQFFGNSIENYLLAFGVFIFLLFIFSIIEEFIINKLEKKYLNGHAVRSKIRPYIYLTYIAFYAALQILNISPAMEKTSNVILVILIIYLATRITSHVIEFILKKASMIRGTEPHEKSSAYYAISIFANIILWATGVMMILSNLGVNITALVASLGIGGIAVALAAQNILGDLFSSFSIYIDKPFDIGDFIIVGDHMGTVKKIGLKTTRVISLKGDEIVFSNRELTTTRIQNYKKMQKRRVQFRIGVKYDTPPDKLKKIPGEIVRIINSKENSTLDRAHFREFGNSSLVFEIVYFFNSTDYNRYMDILQEINIEIKEYLDEQGIGMAPPN